jgi:hypothetical protein
MLSAGQAQTDDHLSSIGQLQAEAGAVGLVGAEEQRRCIGTLAPADADAEAQSRREHERVSDPDRQIRSLHEDHVQRHRRGDHVLGGAIHSGVRYAGGGADGGAGSSKKLISPASQHRSRAAQRDVMRRMR